MVAIYTKARTYFEHTSWTCAGSAAGQVDPRRIAESILPWYLMRAVTYLEDNSNADEATDEVQQQFTLAMRQWNHEASHH